MSELSKILIVALDPGTINTGVCLAQDGKILGTDTIHVPSKRKSMTRILDMMEKIDHYTIGHVRRRQCTEEISQIHIPYESPGTFHGDGDQGRPIMALHQLVAIIEYWARGMGYQTFPYSVNAIKEGSAGDSRASKLEVQTIMQHEYNLHQMELTDHEWDAISIFTYHARQLAVEAAII